jgi:hypothetical protein
VSVVLVVGPPLSGASAVAAALRPRLTGCQVSEAVSKSFEGVGFVGSTGSPDVVVFVVSAAAPMAHCDAALLDAAAIETDAVVAVIAKTDVHRTWRAVLETNRAALARHSPRYRTTPWVGVAAAPQIGDRVVDPLVDAVRAALGDSTRAERNRRRAAGVRAERAAQRQAQAARRNAVRVQVRHTRLELGAQARARAVSLRSELQHQAASASRREIGGFVDEVRSRVAQTAGAFDELVRDSFAQSCRRAGLPVPDVRPAPRVWEELPPPHRPAADSATVVFAAAFGMGVALTLGRLLVELTGVALPATLPGCGPAGVALAVWVVRARRLAAARLAAERWVAEVSAELRSALDDRVLAAESSLLAAIATDDRSPN